MEQCRLARCYFDRSGRPNSGGQAEELAARLLYETGQITEAKRAYLLALARFRSSRVESSECLALLHLAECLMATGEPRASYRMATVAIKIHQDLDSPLSLGLTHVALFRTAAWFGDSVALAQHRAEAARALETAAVVAGSNVFAEMIGHAELDLGDAGAAATSLRQVRSRYAVKRVTLGFERSSVGLAAAEVLLGHADIAVDPLLDCVARAERSDYPLHTAVATARLLGVFALSGQREAAEIWEPRALAANKRCGFPVLDHVFDAWRAVAFPERRPQLIHSLLTEVGGGESPWACYQDVRYAMSILIGKGEVTLPVPPTVKDEDA